MTPATESSSNPYQTPTARVGAPHGSGLGDIIPGGRHRPAGHGLTWIGQGWRQFASAPLPWIGVTIVFTILTIVTSAIPYVSIFTAVINTVLVGGIYLGCRATDSGERFAFRYLFAGFSSVGFGRLAGVGALLLLCYLVFVLLAGLTFAVGVGVAALPVIMNPFGHLDALRGAIGLILGISLLALTYFTLVSMLALFSPILAVIHDQSVTEALKSSFTGCMRNVLSLTVYSLVLMGLALACILTLGLGFLVLAPVFWSSTYYAARDIFEA